MLVIVQDKLILSVRFSNATFLNFRVVDELYDSCLEMKQELVRRIEEQNGENQEAMQKLIELNDRFSHVLKMYSEELSSESSGSISNSSDDTSQLMSPTVHKAQNPFL